MIFRECVTNIDYAAEYRRHQDACLASAQLRARTIDCMKMPDMVGTLSGDDTALVIMRDKESAAEFCRRAAPTCSSKEPPCFALLHIENIAVIEQADILF